MHTAWYFCFTLNFLVVVSEESGFDERRPGVLHEVHARGRHLVAHCDGYAVRRQDVHAAEPVSTVYFDGVHNVIQNISTCTISSV